jgi:hypothetical protein
MADSKDDYTEHYNTPLSEPEQQSYDGWEKAQSDKLGRDVHSELKDYDLQGYWRANVGDTDEGPQLGQGHLTDEFKKPNHPTFSDESIYHGVAGNKGGTWEELPGGETGVHAYRFKPGATNLEHHEPAELKGYFDRVEPGNTVDLPAEPAKFDYGRPGQIDRSRIADELQAKPWLRERLKNMVMGEVGANASPEVRRIQIESAMNRALDRGHSLEQALWDTSGHGKAGYYPIGSFQRGGHDEKTFSGDLDAVLAGSDYGSKYGRGLITGNASGDVARHQFGRGTPGFTVETGSGPESYFSEPGVGGRTPSALNPNAPAVTFARGTEAMQAQQAAEAAAGRMRRSVRPEGGRQEGAATDVATHIIPTMARSAVSSALAGPRAMEEVFAGELDPMSPEGIAAARNIALGTVGRPAMKPSLGSGVALPGAKEVATEAAKQPIREPERRSRDEPRAAPPDRLPDASKISQQKTTSKREKRSRAADRA